VPKSPPLTASPEEWVKYLKTIGKAFGDLLSGDKAKAFFDKTITRMADAARLPGGIWPISQKKK
jgi:hypothetical protein